MFVKILIEIRTKKFNEKRSISWFTFNRKQTQSMSDWPRDIEWSPINLIIAEKWRQNRRFSFFFFSMKKLYQRKFVEQVDWRRSTNVEEVAMKLASIHIQMKNKIKLIETKKCSTDFGPFEKIGVVLPSPFWKEEVRTFSFVSFDVLPEFFQFFFDRLTLKKAKHRRKKSLSNVDFLYFRFGT